MRGCNGDVALCIVVLLYCCTVVGMSVCVCVTSLGDGSGGVAQRLQQHAALGPRQPVHVTQIVDKPGHGRVWNAKRHEGHRQRPQVPKNGHALVVLTVRRRHRRPPRPHQRRHGSEKRFLPKQQVPPDGMVPHQRAQERLRDRVPAVIGVRRHVSGRVRRRQGRRRRRRRQWRRRRQPGRGPPPTGALGPKHSVKRQCRRLHAGRGGLRWLSGSRGGRAWATGGDDAVCPRQRRQRRGCER